MNTNRYFPKILIGLLAIILFTSSLHAEEGKLLTDIIFLATLDEARDLVTTEDEYTDKWSSFDIVSRSQDLEGTKEDVLRMMSKQMMGWTLDETRKIGKVLKEIDADIMASNFRLPFPEEITLIKSTLAEEGGAHGYTRGDYIVLRQDLFFRDDDMLKNILLHELFHILSRHDANFRRDIYKTIGFTVCNEIQYPEEIADLKITNPDAHNNDSYIHLTTNDSMSIDAVMLIYAKEPWKGGSFFTYLQIGFAAVEGPEADKKIVYKDGQPLIYDFSEVNGFLEQVGGNTQYIIDPEEIAADNFAYAFEDDSDKPTPETIERIREIITAK